MTNNNSVAKIIIINDLERIPHLKKKNLKQASAIANKIHPNVMSRITKPQCDAKMCVIFPCDEDNDWDEIIECKNGCNIHIRYEGVVLIKGLNENAPENYECEKCRSGNENVTFLEEKLIVVKTEITSEILSLSINTKNLK